MVTAPGVGCTITVEADELLEPLLDVTADGAIVSVRQIALVGRERFAGIWPWGPETSRVRVTVPDGTRLDASVDAGSISAEHSWDHVQVHADAGSIVIGTLRDGSVWAQAGSVCIRSTTGTVSAHTEAGFVKVLAAYEGLLDLCDNRPALPESPRAARTTPRAAGPRPTEEPSGCVEPESTDSEPVTAQRTSGSPGPTAEPTGAPRPQPQARRQDDGVRNDAHQRGDQQVPARRDR